MNLLKLVAHLGLDKTEYEQGLNDAESKADGFGKAFTGAAKVGAAALGMATTAAVAFGTSSVMAGKDFDSAMSQVAATMGVSVDDIQDLRDFAQDMGSTTAFSATEAADALNYMALAGYDAETSMSMLPNVLNLAAAGNIDLAHASDMVTDASSALGLNLDETSAMVDKMAKASSKSNTSVEQLGDAILAVGGTAKSMSGGTTELATALGIMADSGIKGAEAGTHMRNILLSLTPKSEDAAKAMEALGLNAYDADGNLRPLEDTFAELAASLSDYSAEGRTELLSNIFNKTDLAAVDALISAASYDIGSLSDSLHNSGIEWSKYGDKLGEFEGSIDDVASSVQAWIAQGTSEEHILKRLRDGYGLTAEDAVTAFNTISRGIDEQGNRWTELTGYIDDADGAAKAMAETQLDNLEGDVTLFKSALEGLQIAISDGLSPTLRDFVQFGSEGLSRLTASFKEGGIDEAMATFGDLLTEGLNMILEKLPEMVEAGKQLLTSVVSGLIDTIPTLVEAAVQIVTSLAQDISDSIPELIPAAIETITSLVAMLIENVPALVESALAIIISLANGIVDNIPTLLESLPKVIAAVVSTLINLAPKLVTSAVKLMLALGKFLVQSIPDLLKSIPSIIKAIVDGLIAGTQELRDAGKQLLEGLWNGINDKVEWLKGKVSGVVDKIKGWFTGSKGFDEHSPSRWAADVFEKLLEGGVEGLEAGERGLLNGVNGVVDAVKDSFSSPMSINGNIGNKQRISDTESIENAQPINIQLTLDGTVLAQLLVDPLRRVQQFQGGNYVTMGGSAI